MLVLIVADIRQVLRGKAVDLCHIGIIIVIIPELPLHAEGELVPFISRQIFHIFLILDTKSQIAVGGINDSLVIVSVHGPLVIQKIHPLGCISHTVSLTDVVILHNAVADLAGQHSVKLKNRISIIKFSHFDSRF